MDDTSLTLIVIVFALLAGAAFCHRMSSWHMKESRYWHEVANKVLVMPALDLTYRPILNWVQINKPSVYEKVVYGWQPPTKRYRDGR